MNNMTIEQLQEENIRLKNNWNKLEEYIKGCLESFKDYPSDIIKAWHSSERDILEMMKKIEEKGKNE